MLHALFLNKMNMGNDMAWKALGVAAIALAAISANTLAVPVLNFEGSQDGALIQDFYNGGTDSFGNSGGNYGVSFGGGVVRVVNGLTYLTNVSSVRIAGGFENGVSFNYSTRQSAYGSNGLPIGDPGVNDFVSSFFDINGQKLEENYMGNMTTGSCQDFSGQFCLFGGSRFIYPDVLLGSFSFSTNAAIDTIAFGSVVAPPNERASHVPEPTTIALLGLGLLGFATSRRKSSKSKNT